MKMAFFPALFMAALSLTKPAFAMSIVPEKIALPSLRQDIAVYLDESGKDPRVEMTATQYPWSTIGKIYMSGKEGNAVCTGTLVGPSIVVTAAHCLLNKDGTLVSAVFYPDVIDNRVSGEYRSANMLVAKAKLGTHAYDVELDKDWAVVPLDARLGDKAGWMGVSPLRESDLPLEVIDVGYSRDFRGANTAGVTNSCYIEELYPIGAFGHSCSIEPGASGGPLFRVDDKGGAYIYGVNTRTVEGATYDSYSSGTSYAVMTDRLVNTVRLFRQEYDHL